MGHYLTAVEVLIGSVAFLIGMLAGWLLGYLDHE